MIGKYPAPFALSGITLIMAYMGAINSKLYAAEIEAPAILHFATSYQQQHQPEIKVPAQPSPEHRKVNNSATAPRIVTPSVSHLSQGQLTTLRNEIAEMNQQIAQKNRTIDSLEQQMIALRHSATVSEVPHFPPVDTQALLEMVQNLRQVFSLHPTHNTLVEKLAQVKDQLKEVQLAETALRTQLKALNDGKDNIVDAHETASKQQIEQHNLKIAELEAALSASHKDVETITAERDAIQTKEQALLADNDRKKQALLEEKQQLLEQIAKITPIESELEASDKQRQALQQQIEQYNQKIAELETALAASHKNIETITAERDAIQTKEQSLLADNDREKQVLIKEKQQLLEQIAKISPVESELEASDKQRQALQQQLAEAQQLKTTLEDDRAQLQSQLATRPTNEQLAESQLKVKSLQAQMDLVQLQQTAAVTRDATTGDVAAETSASAADKNKSDKLLPELQAKLDAALLELEKVKKQKAGVKIAGNLPGGITPEQLKNKSSRESYAIGISLGDEILQMQAENNNWGTATEKSTVLAGIVDAFQGQTKLSTETLKKTLTEVSHREETDQKNMMTNLDKATKKYLQSFTKMKNTKKSPSGFWYNISYEGDTPIPENATLDVVVKESLTNGEVITDMDASGTMLTQSLSDFPPIFRESLEKLKNHGSITIVVPPEHAYKEKGFPPKIPPNATIVYTLRISEAYP